MFINSIWALLPPLVAIILALITKEVYSSLFVGIVCGGLLYAEFNPVTALEHVFSDGMIGQLSDPWNVGILIFLVILGSIVILMNRAGGSAAFGRWASLHVKTRMGAQLATVALGVLIFIDDYFNCLTVGSVMRPITDKNRISREKLAYLIDATAAPICIIAPISSWAAAVTGFVEGTNGLALFIRAIPYNLYAFLTIAMMLVLCIGRFDYGPMKKAEEMLRKGKAEANDEKEKKDTDVKDPEALRVSDKGKVIHLVLPILTLIFCCVIGMIYTGGFFEGESFVDAFANSDASVGLVYGSAVALILTILFYLISGVLSFKECMETIPAGFKSMVPAILILTLAWTLKSMTDSLGAGDYVAGLVGQVAENGMVMSFLPAFVFLIGAFLSFATGTSWGTFGLLIPIVVAAFGSDPSNELMIISISACMAGSVCGDHCSPISDTTIMASAGADCVHIRHVSTQLPYALTAAGVSLAGYVLTGFVRNWLITLPLSLALMVGVLLIIKNLGGESPLEKTTQND